MKVILILALLLSTFGFSQIDSAICVDPYIIGDRVEVYSPELKENRFLNVYLPNDYSPDSSIQYPVIYVLDGSMDEDEENIMKNGTIDLFIKLIVYSPLPMIVLRIC